MEQRWVYVNEPDSEVICALCSQPFTDPVTSCGEHTFCRECINQMTKCPQCEIEHTETDLKTAPKIGNMIGELLVQCLHCSTKLKLDYFDHHWENDCNIELKRSELSQHKTVCKEKGIACLGSEVGCTFKSKRGMMQEHIATCSILNQRELLRTIQKLEFIIQQQDDTLKKVNLKLSQFEQSQQQQEDELKKVNLKLHQSQRLIDSIILKPVKFRLESSTIKGVSLEVLDNGLSVSKTRRNHCTVSTKTPFNNGIHRWKVILAEKHSWATENWLFMGVHTDPTKASYHPKGDTGAYGLSVSSNQKGWVILRGKRTISKSRLTLPGDKVITILDCDRNKIHFKHMNWEETLTLPNKGPWYPFFDPYDLDFSIRFC